MSFRPDRRWILGAGTAGIASVGAGGLGGWLMSGESADGAEGTRLSFSRFVQNMPIAPVKKPLATGVAPWIPGDCFHGIAPEYYDRVSAEDSEVPFPQFFPEQYYELRIRETLSEIIPGVRTPVLGYDGLVPGPTFKVRSCQPIVVRQYNELTDTELSTHLHGGHNPAHSDGYPNFYILPGKSRDYFYTNTVPLLGGKPDFSECPSTCWYHDHAMDISGDTLIHGLCGFYLQYDDHELSLIGKNILPGDPFDIPVMIQDRRFNSDGTIFYDPLDHNGYLGDVYCVNGKAFPKFHVQRRKYRFRFLNGCNARHLELRLSDSSSFIGLGTDSWLYPEAIVRETLLMSPAKRADVVIDFTNAPSELYLENILSQTDGRGPNGSLFDRDLVSPGTQVLKFVVEGPRQKNSATVSPGVPLRPHIPIRAEEVTETRVFEFHRRNGAWQINQRFFDEFRADACPRLGSAERWILRNGSGGWWHPVHIHLESHQIQKIDGRQPPLSERYKVDTTMLGPNTEAEIFMRFRTFRGPFVFHCHNLEHEDMRMMFVVDPRTDGPLRDQPLQQFHP
ncbi:MAG UNVERIFIED_CONTAM: multicopper oxidase family protein [Planctomycetaceae bacterium]